jgi:hypothetical protein
MPNRSIWGQEFFGAATTVSQEFKVAVTPDGELASTSTERERNVMVHYQSATISVADVYAVGVDLSDTTNFPHDQTGRIDLSWIKIEVDKSNNAQGTVSLGVITSIDTASSNITYFTDVPFENNSADALITQDWNLAPSQIKLGVSGGSTTRIISNVTETSVTAVNLATTLDSPNGLITPGLGDMVIKFGYTAGTRYSADVEVMYHAQESP